MSEISTACVVGLGKIGLPLAVQYARRGLTVVGADINQVVVDQVNGGVEPFPGEADLAERLQDVVDAGRLTATTDTPAAVRASDVTVVVVPLIVDAQGVPDFSILDAATRTIAEGLTAGSLVVYETTLPVYTTRHRFVPALEAGSGLRCGDDFHVVFSPERVYSGRIFADLARYPKLVGGIDPGSTARAVEFYERVLEFDERPDLPRPNGVWDLGTAEAAELAKLAETTYRDINIGFANELAVFAESAGIDAHGVIDAANSQPFSHIHRPGIAVGGHCIPVYPRLLMSNAPVARIPAAARDSNEAMPSHAIARLEGAIGSVADRHVVVLGVAYRGGVKETAFSGAFPLAAELRRLGATVTVHDPLYSDDELRNLGFEPHSIGKRCDAAIIHTDHDDYRSLTPADLPGILGLMDGRGVTEPATWRDAGVIHLQLGVG